MTRSTGRTRVKTLGVGALVWLAIGCGGGGGDGNSGPCPAESTEAPDVAGDYVLSGPALGPSNCPDAIDDILQDAIDNAEECVFTVSQDGATVTAVDCEAVSYHGCVNERGLVTLSSTQRDSQRGCNVRVDAELAANLTLTPTDGSLILRFRISGACIVRTDCTAVIHATVSEAAQLPSTASVSLPRAAVHGLRRE